MIMELIVMIIWGIIWGFACNAVIHNKGYDESWFKWGFLFEIIAFIVALTKQDNYKQYNQYEADNSILAKVAQEKREEDLMRRGGW